MMLKLFSICLLVCSLSQFQLVQSYDIYTVCKFDDLWDDFYSYGTNIRQNYLLEKFNALEKSFENVTDYRLQKMSWHYLKKGSVIQGVYVSILNKVPFPSTNSTTAVQTAILKVYPNTSILFLKEDTINVGALQQYKITLICSFNQTWLNDYSDLSSYNSKLFIKNFEVKIKTAFNQIYRLGFLSVTFTSLSQGSIRANLTLYVNETTYPLYDYQVRDSINSSFEIAYGTEMSFVITKIEPYVPPSQITDGGKHGFYIVTTFTNNISLSTFDLKSEFLSNISKVGPFVDATFRGTVVNLRNDNKTGELVGILYASQETINNFNIQNISATYLKGKTFSNTFIYYLYFTIIDFRINSVLFDPDYMDSSHWKTNYIKSELKANINQTLTNLGLTMFDPGVPSLNEISIRLSNESGKLRTNIFFYFFSNAYIIKFKENSDLIQNITRSYNWTLFNSFWDIISTYSSKGDKIYEFYVTGSMNVPSYMIKGYQPEALANYINSVYFNIINLLLPYGVFYQAEVLNINYATGVVDFHGSMLTRSPLLSDLNNIVSMMSPWTSLYNLFNLVIYNIYKANIFISINKDVISTYSSLNRSYIENIQYYIMSRLMQSNLILMDKNYFNFGLESLISENRNGIFSYFLVSSTNDNLYEVQRQIQNIFLSLPSTIDPFNTNIERYHRYLTDTNYLTTTTTSSSTITTTSIPIITSSTIPTSSSLSSTITSTTATLSSTTPTILPTTTITSPTTSTPSSSSTSSTTTTTTSTSTTTLSPSTTSLSSSPTPSSTTSTISPTSSSTTPTPSSSSSTSVTSTTLSTTPTTSSTNTITTNDFDTITKVDMKCSFNETYKEEYSDTNSVVYQSYTKSIYKKLVDAFLNTILRILTIKFNSITEGSVVVDMEITTASATQVDSDSVTQIVKENAPKAFDSSMTILNINSTVLYKPTSTPRQNTYWDSNFPPWGIALIIVCVIVIIVVAIILIYTGRRYSHLSEKEV